MKQISQLFLFISIILWAVILGAVVYSHMVFFSAYLTHLPASTALLKGDYGLHDEKFWMMIHPALIASLLLTLLLNWRLATRRKYILVALAIYALAIVATFLYFVPELKNFAASDQSTIPAAEWLERGNRWQYLSWTRGAFMFIGFIFLLVGLTKNDNVIRVADHPGP